MENVAQSVSIPENETTLFQLDSFAVAVKDLNPDTFQKLHFSIDVNSTVIRDSDISFEENSGEATTASLNIPGNILRNLTTSESSEGNSSIPRITIVAYLNDSLFSRQEERNDSVVGSIVLAASLSVSSSDGGKVENVKVVNLDPPVQLVFLKKPSAEKGTNTSCNFWDFSADGKPMIFMPNMYLLFSRWIRRLVPNEL